MTVGDRIRQRRKDVGVSAEQLAQALGVHRSTVFRYENGDIEKLPGDALIPIARALHTSPAYLMGWETEADAARRDALSQTSRDDRESGRTEAREQMLRAHGAAHATHLVRMVDGRPTLLYCRAFDDARSASAASALLGTVEQLAPEDAAQLGLLAGAYASADERTRTLVELALAPFLASGEAR